MTVKQMLKRYMSGMDVLFWLNTFGVYIYACLWLIPERADCYPIVLLAGLNTAVILITRFHEIVKDLSPKEPKSTEHKIVRRIK